jgi:electron transfer flavoprotein alpha subunit
MVLVFVESPSGHIKKQAYETVSYAYKTAQLLGTQVVALTIGKADNAGVLGQYGASKVLNVAGNNDFDSQVYTAIIAEVAKSIDAKVIILSHSSSGKSLTGRLAARFQAGNVSGANRVPTLSGSALRVKKNVFSGKAIAEYEIKSSMKIISVMGNSIPAEKIGNDIAVESFSVHVPAARIKVKEVKTETGGQVPLPEAELVVSAGRGMKDPSNWGIIEELAASIGATTACSRPVADAHWRPHHEHVGQTGVAIRPNLYIAIGISGAIQHLAGVNGSKVIVVINKDPEAPFFKAADYGVVGDLFEIVPRLTAAFKNFKAGQ